MDERFAEADRARANGDPALARLILTDTIEAERQAGNGADLGDALARLGRIERDEGHKEAAIALYEEAADVARSEGRPLRLAHHLRHIGDIHIEQDDRERAMLLYGEALALYRADPVPPALDLANLLRPMAMMREESGEAGAEVLWAEAKSLYEQAGVVAGARECARHLAAPA
jgi:tetratricopeptide (TPR) repeat protein